MNFSTFSMILFLLIAPQILVNAQTTATRTCASAEILKKQIHQNPHLADRLEQMERTTARFAPTTLETRGTIVIPVVVHVLYSTTTQNISDAQILSQIAVLNRDFRKTNPDIHRVPALFSGVAADCGIQFKLATRDPQGNETNGIRRYSTKRSAWNTNEEMKSPEKGGAAAWDATQYLNFWVCNMGDGTLGYAQFPGVAPETRPGGPSPFVPGRPAFSQPRRRMEPDRLARRSGRRDLPRDPPAAGHFERGRGTSTPF